MLAAVQRSQGQSIRIDREHAIRTLLLAALLLWPLLLFGRPAYIQDSVAYLKGGKVAVEYAMDALDSRLERPASGAVEQIRQPTVPGGKPVAQVSGARSAWYSVAAYLFRGPDNQLFLLAMVQSLVAAFVIAVAATAFGSRSRRAFLPMAAVVTIGTPLVYVVNLTIPDLFAGLLVLCLAVLLFAYDRLSIGVKLALLAIATFAVASHASIPPLALSVALVGIFLYLLRSRTSARLPRTAVAILFVPFIAGSAMTAVSGLVAFGEASVAPKRYPLALARSVADGPGRWYLQEECKLPRYAVCEIFGTNIPATVSEFVFDDGLDGRATPEQMDRIRAEEPEIVLQAALRYPGTELGNFAVNLAAQLVLFNNQIARFDQIVVTNRAGEPFLRRTSDGHSAILFATDMLNYAVVLVAVGWLAVRFRSLEPKDRDLVIFIAVALLANAAICVLFSGVAKRYELRMIWIIPVIALSFALRRRNRSRQENHALEELPART